MQEATSHILACTTDSCSQPCVQALIHRAATGRPFSILKYAMTADGKIATTAGHAAWVSCAESRARVFAARARSDAVIVGGNTVRRDNPRLTTRAETGHTPVRIVMSRTLDLPEVRPLCEPSGSGLEPVLVLLWLGRLHLKPRGCPGCHAWHLLAHLLVHRPMAPCSLGPQDAPLGCEAWQICWTGLHAAEAAPAAGQLCGMASCTGAAASNGMQQQQQQQQWAVSAPVTGTGTG